MGKVTFEFDEFENKSDVLLIVNRNKLACSLEDLANYRRNLYKYESRGQIPVDEIIDNLDKSLDFWYYISEDAWY